MEYKKLECKSALNKVKGGFPYKWDLNIYRGCENGCKYCYAIYSHKYLDEGNFFLNIYYKKGILEALEKELSSKNWKREVVNIGGVTDSYQKIEEKLKIMPEVLKLMIKYKTPVIISIKSNLILRDIDLIKDLSSITYVNVACTIITVDEELRKNLEPNSCKIDERFKVLKEIKNSTNASTGVHIMPIIPFLTDNYDNLDRIYRNAKEVNVNYVLTGTLNLRGETRNYFLDFLKNYDFNIYNKFYKLFYNKEVYKVYKSRLYKRIKHFEEKYNISSNYIKIIKEKMNNN